MEQQSIVEALLLGLLEGLTEFIPVSSTGHILLAGHFLGFESTGKAFEVLIQLGAILAILSVYFSRLWKLLVDFPRDPRTRSFVFGILVAFFPAVVICVMLILGGVVLLWVDRWKRVPIYRDIMDYPLGLCLKIGLFQCLAMIPGTSRSGATIVGALLMGTDKRSAAEFSFFLAMPTMAGAFAYDFYKNRNILSPDDAVLIAVGFLASFVVAVFVVRSLLDFVSRRGYGLFGWWRIIVGVAGMAALLIWG